METNSRAVYRLTFDPVLLEAKSSGSLYLKSAWHPRATSVSWKRWSASVVRRSCPHQAIAVAATRWRNPPFSWEVTAFLSLHFQNRVERHDPVAWPPRSPDLTPLDYCLWRCMKSLVCAVKEKSHNGFFCTHKKRQNLCYDICYFIFAKGHNVRKYTGRSFRAVTS